MSNALLLEEKKESFRNAPGVGAKTWQVLIFVSMAATIKCYFHQFVNIHFHSLFTDSMSLEAVSFPACPLRRILERKPGSLAGTRQAGTAELGFGRPSVQPLGVLQ